MNTRHPLAWLACIAVVVAACSGGPILANSPVATPLPVISPSPLSALPDPQPIVLPRDDGPHHRLTEWWYYTGHLATETGRRFGFEFVVFRAERGAFPVSWASHLALTDEARGQFLYGQRTEIGPQVDSSPRGADGTPQGFSLAISGFDPARGVAPAPPWSMSGSGGTDTLEAAAAGADLAADPGAQPFGLQLGLSTDRPAVLHDATGFVSFGEAGASYYYSRPALRVTGAVRVGSQTLNVAGEAWFDHQWGDFIAVGGGGWDWFAVNLADQTAFTLSLVRDASGADRLVYGTLVHRDGTSEHLGRESFTVTALGTWTSPHTGARYPAGWHVDIPGRGLDVTLTPTLPDQELDTRPSTGVVYWEGSQRVTAMAQGRPVAGEAYVELTGYGSSASATASPSPTR